MHSDKEMTMSVKSCDRRIEGIWMAPPKGARQKEYNSAGVRGK